LQHEEDLRGLSPKCGLVSAEKVKGAVSEAADLQEARRQRLRRIRWLLRCFVTSARIDRIAVAGWDCIKLIIPVGQRDASAPRRTGVAVPDRRAELAEDEMSMNLAIRQALEVAGVEFIDENGCGPGVRLRKRPQQKSRISTVRLKLE
jgi:hypothetical protein